MKWIILDFGTYRLKALRVEIEGQKIHVDDFIQWDAQEGHFKGLGFPEPKAWATVTGGLREADWLADHDLTVSTSLPSAYLETRYLRFPFRAPKKIEKVLPIELETSIPFDIEDILIRHKILDASAFHSHKKDTVVNVMSYRREHVKTFEAELRKFQISIPPMTAQILALEALREVLNEPPLYAIMEIGHSKTQLLLLQKGGQPLGLRTFWWGGKDILSTFQNDLQIEPAQAVEVLHNLDMSDTNSPVSKAAMKSAHEFLVDLRQSLKAWQAEGFLLPKPFMIYTFGQPTKSSHLTTFLEAGLHEDFKVQIPRLLHDVSQLKSVSGMEQILEPDAALPALAVALCHLKTHRAKVPMFSESGFQFQQNLKRLKSGSYSLLKRVALILVFPFIFAIVQIFIQSREDKRMMAELEGILKSSGLTVNTSQSTGDIVALLKRELAENRKKLESLREDASSPLIELTKISKAIPPTLKLDVKDFHVTNELVSIMAQTDSQASAESIIGKLREIYPDLKVGQMTNCSESPNKSCTMFTIEAARGTEL